MPKHSGFVLDVSPAARRDIADILQHSREQFGDIAEARYDVLMKQALRDLQDDPERTGAKHRPDLLSGVRTYHVAFSRDRVSGRKVRSPRHFILYRIDDQMILILRVLHDVRDLARHLPP